MLDIKLNNKVYKFKTSIEDLNVGEFLKLTNIQNLRELDKNGEEIEKDFESSEFRINKSMKILSYLSTIPIKLFETYPTLGDELFRNLGSFVDNSDVWYTKEIDGKFWKWEHPSKWTFAQFVEYEESFRRTSDILNPFVLSLFEYKKDGKYLKHNFNRFLPNFNTSKEYWLKQPAQGFIKTLYNFIDTVIEYKKYFPFIFSDDNVYPEGGTNLKIYQKFAGWNDVIVNLSCDNFLNVEKIRKSNCYEVLEYLNLKYGKSKADYLDDLEKNKTKLI